MNDSWETLTATRAKLELTLTELHGVLASEYGQAEAIKSLGAQIDAANAQVEAKLRAHTVLASPTDLLNPKVQSGQVSLLHALLLVVGPEQLKARLGRLIAESLPESISAETRRRKIAKLNAEIEALGDAEEVEITRLESLGVRVYRRADANPAIVLKVRP